VAKGLCFACSNSSKHNQIAMPVLHKYFTSYFLSAVPFLLPSDVCLARFARLCLQLQSLRPSVSLPPHVFLRPPPRGGHRLHVRPRTAAAEQLGSTLRAGASRSVAALPTAHCTHSEEATGTHAPPEDRFNLRQKMGVDAQGFAWVAHRSGSQCRSGALNSDSNRRWPSC